MGQIPAASTESKPMANTTLQEHLGNLRTEANRLVQGSISTNTHKAYQGASTNFKKFLKGCGLALVFPIPIGHLILLLICPFQVQLLCTLVLYFIFTN